MTGPIGLGLSVAVVLDDTMRIRHYGEPGFPLKLLWPDVGYRHRVVWRGPANVPVFALEDSRDTVWEHLDIWLDTPCEAVLVCERTKTGPGTIPPTNHQFRDVRVFGNGLSPRGFWFRPTIDENNEHMSFDAVSVYGCTEVGVEFGGQQSKEHRLDGLRVEGAKVGVRAASSFAMTGGTVSGARLGVHFSRVGDPVSIRGTGFEACQRLLETERSTAAQPVTLEAVRFAADALHEDGDMIVMRHAGPLTATGCSFGDGKQPVPRIACDGFGDQDVVLLGNKFGSFGAHRVCPVHGLGQGKPNVQWGKNRYQRFEHDPKNTESRITWPATDYWK